MGDEDVATIPEEPVPVVVAVRVKPNTENAPIAIQADPTNNTITLHHLNHGELHTEIEGETYSKTQQFKYDYVFSESSSQEAVYATSVEQFVSLVLDGFDLTVAAYGQSGCGKTHTLLGPDLPFAMNEADFGLVSRVVRDLFHRSNSSRFEVHASYFDVDDEKIFDLLACRVVEPLLPSSDAEVPYGRAYTAALGLYNMECNSIEDVMRCLEKGLHFHAERRSLDNDKAAAFLDHHTIFQLDVRLEAEVSGARRITESTVRFVDFVGSDKLLSGGNRGLLSLDLVVSALGNPRRNAADKAMYHGSPVTRILRDSIAGTTMTVVLCCVSPLAADADETIRSLEFGARANKIGNDPKLRITLIPLLTDMDDEDEDISQVRSASVNHGNLPPLSPPSRDFDGGCSNNNDAESSISISNFSQHVELHQQQQQDQQIQLLAEHLHTIAPPPPPGVDPILYNLHLIQYSGLLEVTMAPPVARPSQIENGFDEQGVHYHPHLPHQQVIRQQQDQISPLRSSPTLSPPSQRSPQSAGSNLHWQSTPMQNQRCQALMPPPVLDPAATPISLAADELEQRGSDDGSTVRKSEGDVSKHWRKLPSILEVSENGSVTNSSTSTTTGANVNAVVQSLVACREEQESDHGDEDEGTTTGDVTELDSEEFDSECSDFSEIEAVADSKLMATLPRVTDLMERFVAETEDIVRQSESERRVSWTKPMVDSLAALHIQPENVHMGSRREEEMRLKDSLKELREAQNTIKILMSKESQILERQIVIESREKVLKKEAKKTELLRASLEEQIKENEVSAFSAETMKEDCKKLRRVKEKRYSHRIALEKESEDLRKELHQKPDDKQVVANFIANRSRIAEIDEVANIVDLAIEFKNEKLTGKALDYLGNGDRGDDPDVDSLDLEKSLFRLLKRTSTEECRALIHRMMLRTTTLSAGLEEENVKNVQLSYKLEETTRRCRGLNEDLVGQRHKYHERSRNARREYDKKVQLLSKQVDDRDVRIKELEHKNKYLTKFYRDHNNEGCLRHGEGSTAEPVRSRRVARERNPDLIEVATDSPSAASSSTSKRGKKTSVTMEGQKLVIAEKPTGRVHGVQRPSM